MRPDGSGTVERLTAGVAGHAQYTEGITRDGSHVIFEETNVPGRGIDVRMVSTTGERVVEDLIASEFQDAQPELSPDDRWLAYASNRSGQVVIYVSPFADVNSGRVAVSAEADPLAGARWATRNGSTELFYVSNTGRLMSVLANAGPTFSPQPPTELFDASGYITRFFDVTPDGERFVFVKPAAGTTDRIVVVEHWLSDLAGRGGQVLN